MNRQERILSVLRTLSGGEVVDLGKSDGSRRQVPLSRRALYALDASRHGSTLRSCSRPPAAGC